MRSNIARTCGSSKVPEAAPPAATWPCRSVIGPSALVAAVERAEEVHEIVELLRVVLLEAAVRRHRRGRVLERAADRLAWQALADLGQFRARPGVPVLADLVAAETAGGRHHVLAVLVLRG